MRSNKNKEIAYKVLKIAGMGVLFTVVSILAPKFPYLVLKEYLKKCFREDYKDRQLRNSIKYLKRKNFIAFKNKRFILTKLGRKYLKRRYVFTELEIKKVPWDNKWRIVSFDIPKEQTPASSALRDKLKELGFFHFQRSVFIIPYPCEKEIEELTEELGISEHVHILVADRFKNDKVIVRKFKLK